ncbi:MAG: hypothetical protein J6Y24_13600 [Bacteroidales bacterium]|nr:hypothetical protein [Bacteroidales bacterium]
MKIPSPKRVLEIYPINDSMHITQVIDYNALFGSKQRPSLDSLLNGFSREQIIKIVCVLNNLYCDATIADLNTFFSSNNLKNRTIVENKLQHLLTKRKQYYRYIWTTSEVPLQLLKYEFSKPYNSDIKALITKEDAEMNIFKSVLLINQETVKYKMKRQDSNLDTIIFLHSAINANMRFSNEYEKQDRSIMQMYFGIEFFKFLQSEKEYVDLLQQFLTKRRANCWQDYIRTIFGIVAISNYKSGFIDLQQDKNHLINGDILASLSLQFEKTIPSTSNNQFDRANNVDYKFFRSHPIIKMPNGSYCIFYWSFMIDCLYNYLYFDFKDLTLPDKIIKQIPNIFTDKFAEKYLFDSLMIKSASNSRYVMLSEKLMKCTYANKQIELGPPDYFLANSNCYILFECKDIRIGGAEIESHNFNTILDIYSNKLYRKRWAYDANGNRIDKTDGGKIEGKRIGISQLTYHISSIRNSAFKYYETKPNTPIYPVLVLTDYKYVLYGFNSIANRWYRTDLGDKYNSIIDKPLIVMSFITLIKYHHLFKKNGFEFYFEQYYEFVNLPIFNSDLAIDSYKSFDDFMCRYPNNLSEFLEEALNTVRYDCH